MMIEQQVKDILAKQFGVMVENIGPDTHINQDLNADSLDIVELVLSLERQFKIAIEEEDYQDRQTVASIVDLVSTKIAQKTA